MDATDAAEPSPGDVEDLSAGESGTAGDQEAGPDLALRKAIQAAYRLDYVPSHQEVIAIAEKWRPYRSLATSYLFSAGFEQP